MPPFVAAVALVGLLVPVLAWHGPLDRYQIGEFGAQRLHRVTNSQHNTPMQLSHPVISVTPAASSSIIPSWPMRF
ncbi:Uncharacterized protein HZ326_24761 [Fusarium oxysporum f. sp. albedinis]|nr:Uncharacterized protein HZ326_24761 [Fusarium oxysporum f. sp. albedinis]